MDTSGFDFGVNWFGRRSRIGTFSADLKATYVSKFEIKDGLTGLSEPQTVGIETNTSAIPRVKAQAHINWSYQDWQATWTVDYVLNP